MIMRNKRLIRKFCAFFFTTLVCVGAVAFIVIYGFSAVNKHDDKGINQVVAKIESNLKKATNPITEVFTPVQERINFVILGVDDNGTRTDTIMVGCFNTEDEGLSLISVPRDTLVTMPKERRDILKEKNIWTPSDGVMKINEVHHYAGKELGVEFAVKQLEDLLGIKLEYYVKVDFDAFVYLIDEIGGVEFNVPVKMDYDDPYQNLHIHLKPGLQKLNGEDAVKLCRFRSYSGVAMPDIKRAEIQQEFLRATAKQVLSKGNIVSNVVPLINTAYNYVETNFQISDLPKYVKYAMNFSVDNISTYTLTGTPKKIDKDYLVLDESIKKEIIASVYYDETDVRLQAAASISDKKIQVLNGGFTQGMASRNRDTLNGKGYNVVSIGDYTGEKIPATRIVVGDGGDDAGLTDIYKDSEIVIDDTLTDNEIIVILGTAEK